MRTEIMAPLSRFGWPSLAAFFLLFLSLLNIATSSPLPDDHVKKTLVARDQTSITQERYEAYLMEYFPDTGHYLFYSGGSEKQIEAFKAKNSGYYYYDDLFNAHDGNHPWYKAFNEATDEDDGEASSKAMASTASGEVLVFGAIEYKTEGKNSFFTRQEIDILHEGVKTGRINSINHMAKGATDPSQVMAKEDANGVFTWQNGHKEGDKNAGAPENASEVLDDAADALDDWTR
ncbi:hypothetical protein K458DRAFT_114860 [Lentithecium fluviatile CBS 122367]|uniref:Uncharacterized protein n=1 Tax=Lentithecium fluviatile CBS 122367 TaxID=1168545 RepID=A0A6G1IMU1_9PLEO|nr:hypothetical protein K458DRAFT_114860 [Lentithecium fluviatile CBS 122367]